MENSLELKLHGVQEVDEVQLETIDGGSIAIAVAVFIGSALLGAATVEVITEGSAQCWEDFKEGYNSTQN